MKTQTTIEDYPVEERIARLRRDIKRMEAWKTMPFYERDREYPRTNTFCQDADAVIGRLEKKLHELVAATNGLEGNENYENK